MPTIYCEDITNTTGLLSLERVILKKNTLEIKVCVLRGG